MFAGVKPITIFAITSKANEGAIGKSLANEKASNLKFEFVKTLDELEAKLNEEQPAFIVLQYDKKISEKIDRLTRTAPQSEVIVLLPKKNIAEADQILFAGARAFIPVPWKDDEFVNAFVRLYELSRRTHQNGGNQAQEQDADNLFVTVFTPRPGAGASTVAVNLAISMMEQTDKSTLLADGDSYLGHVDLMLNLRAETTITDLIPHVDSLDARLIHNAVSQHASGLNVLLGPESIEEAQSLQAEHVYKIAEALGSSYRYVFVDGGCTLDEKTITWMDMSDLVMVVLSPNLADLRDVQRFLNFAIALHIPSDKFLFVLNNLGMRGSLQEEEAGAALEVDLMASIPYDEPKAVRAINRGVPVSIGESRSGMGRSFEKLAKSLAVVEQTLPPDKAGSGKDILASSSRLG